MNVTKQELNRLLNTIVTSDLEDTSKEKLFMRFSNAYKKSKPYSVLDYINKQ